MAEPAVSARYRGPRENLCERARSTGRDEGGGYADGRGIRAALPEGLDDDAVPLLCTE